MKRRLIPLFCLIGLMLLATEGKSEIEETVIVIEAIPRADAISGSEILDEVVSDEKISAEGFFKIGYQYDNGIGREKSIEKAIEYYEKAAAFKNPGAYYNLGAIYYNGEGVEVDDEKAQNYFNLTLERYIELAKAGDADAQYQLGELYYNEEITKRNLEKSIHYYELAAAQNHPQALNNLAVYYDNGYGVEPDSAKALEYFERSAQLGNIVALYNVGEIYLLGDDDIDKDYEKARLYFEKAAQENDHYALERLVEIYEKGLGVEKDAKLATEYQERLKIL